MPGPSSPQHWALPDCHLTPALQGQQRVPLPHAHRSGAVEDTARGVAWGSAKARHPAEQMPALPTCEDAASPQV